MRKLSENKIEKIKLDDKIKYFEFKTQLVYVDKEFGLTNTPEKKKENIMKE